ncbi:carboxymuconolactone decarboxylase family protein [Planobispora longispora]|uniref:Carboxymuconolactone decarboxylase n=1 Tax=Planobispora longispora TaxID=28887 RepID=A0A8J3RTZ2_9ACTN|nr:carboxymuconolactone decarboxylase family protein [Planobispora longispora]BFE80935.1 carboxymuconolactone decarboxylase family protein [Planobispora longispora]GIH80151.1 carboxymuconolactone decarboxylase [Planobispora longispora]
MNPRVEPLPPEKWDPFLARVVEGTGPYHVFTTLARHPALFQAWIGFGAALLYGTLPARDRELAILRTAHHRGSAYEWAQHVRLAREAGLTDAEIEAVRETGPAGAEETGDGPGAPESGVIGGGHVWDPADRLVLDVADELRARGDLADATWRALCERYDEPGRIEMVMLVAHYDMLAVVLNTLRVPVEKPGLIP